MERIFTRYIEIVGQNKVKETLKEKLLEATKNEDWNLTKEITCIIEIYFNNAVQENETTYSNSSYSNFPKKYNCEKEKCLIDLSQSEPKETDNLSDNCNSIFQHPENIRD